VQSSQVQRSMGVTGTVTTLVGLVVGISIYVLPGQLAGIAGPAMILSYIIAAIVALFSCVVAAQLGSVLPISGAAFVAITRLISPFAGFIIIWLSLGGAAVAVALVAVGATDYASSIVPALDSWVTAPAIILFLGLVNTLGVRDFLLGQTIMVLMFVVALALFVVVGLVNIDTSLLVPFSPNGSGAVMRAVVPAFFSFTGFMLIIEISGDIKNPSRNIPISLGVSFVIVTIVYLLVSAALVGSTPWQSLSESSTPVADVAEKYLPLWLAKIITFTAVAAAATSINALLLTYSRDVLAMAKVGVLPMKFATLSRSRGVPVYGILAVTGLSLLAVAMRGSITQYASVIVMGVMLLQIMVAVSVLRMPRELKCLFEKSAFRLGTFTRWFFCVGLIISSCYFLWVGITTDPDTALFAGIYLMAGTVIYIARGYASGGQSARVRKSVELELEGIR